MSNSVVARFLVQTKTPWMDGKGEVAGYNVQARPVYPKAEDGPDHPNRKFWEATPSGSIQMGITNLAAAEAFEVDAEYEVTFRKI